MIESRQQKDLHEAETTRPFGGIPDNVMGRNLSELRKNAVECFVGNIVVYVLDVEIRIGNYW